MKTLDKLSIKEKADLFHHLFRRDIPDLLNCIENICNAIVKASPEEVVAWDGGLFRRDISYTIVIEAAEKISQYRKKIYNHSGIFADQLFSGYQALFIVYCLRKCSTASYPDNGKIALAVDLFFDK